VEGVDAATVAGGGAGIALHHEALADHIDGCPHNLSCKGGCKPTTALAVSDAIGSGAPKLSAAGPTAERVASSVPM
jgi:hypothetical protein